ncbi:DUF72 domain-containing protein [Microvirga sp. Mcv34]|uniref:DUF72 domain-containing protein n=1 Tax=Microvirga sp. Mcv34 TaxID=2926016 RepID=UPI0021C95A12|nr:DUF72 domain-containing protein [Microvirga sp. Mcv34]
MVLSLSQERRLADVGDLPDRFVSEAGGLGPKLGPLLVQLPPRLSFQPGIADRFLSDLRSRVEGSIVCETRHASWFRTEVEALLDELRIARVAADPAPVSGADEPGGSRAVVLSPARLTEDLLLCLKRGVSSSHRRGARQGCCSLRRDLVHLRQHSRFRGNR